MSRMHLSDAETGVNPLFEKKEANGRVQRDSYLSARPQPKATDKQKMAHRKWTFNISNSEMPPRWSATPDPQRMSRPGQKMATNVTSSKLWPRMGKQINLLQQLHF